MDTDTETRWNIYKITCAVTGRSYIGITKQTVHARWAGHLSTARRGSPVAMARAIRKYGEAAFSQELLALAMSFEDAASVERQLIIDHDTLHPRGYNLTTGGEAIWGRRVTEEARRRMSDSAKKRVRSPDPASVRANKSAARSKLLADRPDLRHAIGEFNRGKTRTPEHRARLAEFGKQQAAARGPTETKAMMDRARQIRWG